MTLRSVAFGNDTFVVVGGEVNAFPNFHPGQSVFLTSRDGARWVEQKASTNWAVSAVTFGNGQFVALAHSNIVASPNGINWTRAATAVTNRLNGLVHAQGKFVAVGDGGAIWSSRDGAVWPRAASATTLNLADIAHGSGSFVAVGGSADFRFAPFSYYSTGLTFTVVGSEDGETWVQRATGSGDLFYSIAYGNGTFVALTQNSVQTSPDGARWTPVARYLNTRRVRFLNGQFILTAAQGNLFTSPDGRRWTVHSMVPATELAGVEFGNNSFVAVGRQSTILQSGALSAAEMPFLFLRARTSRSLDGVLHTAIESKPNISFEFQGSSDLNSWTPLGVKTNQSGFLEITDETTRGMPSRFYRARVLEP